MKTILVYGDNEEEILDKIMVDRVPNEIKWRGCLYTIWNSEVGYGISTKVKDINEYNGKFFFYYDD
jgi:hypothetical protein